MVLNTPYKRSTLHGLEEAAEICFQCGVCCTIPGYSCPAQYNGYTPTETYVYDCLDNPQREMNPALWVCVSCHKCEEMCPYEVSPIAFIESMKETAIKKGNIPDLIVGEIEQVLETGLAFPLSSRTTRDREKLELPPLKTTGELSIIAEKTGLLRIIKKLREEKK